MHFRKTTLDEIWFTGRRTSIERRPVETIVKMRSLLIGTGDSTDKNGLILAIFRREKGENFMIHLLHCKDKI